MLRGPRDDKWRQSKGLSQKRKLVNPIPEWLHSD